MIEVLRHRTYRHLLAAQVIALVGTGLLTVALGLLAYDLAGADAGVVLGNALAIKMIAYIGVAPIVGAYANRLPRKAFLVAMDLIRCAIAVFLPFVSEIWQIYVLIFFLQSASAGFTPTFQATIPDVLPDETEYTRALSLSRLAYDMESLASPALAAALLSVMSFHWLFAGTAVGFICSALLVVSVSLPHARAASSQGGVWQRTTWGIRIYMRTPRLRGLLAVTLAAAAASAMVIVNTVVIVKGVFHRDQADVAVALACYGGGSMLAAFVLPKLLDRVSDRPVMLAAGGALSVMLGALGAAFYSGAVTWPALLAGWLLMGFAYSCSVTPAGRLLRRSSREEDRPALFAAQFALSHGCWLIAYPLAGWIGEGLGQAAAFAILAALALLGTVIGVLAWPTRDPEAVDHRHDDLPDSHPHGAEHRAAKAHAFVIDELHSRWPSNET
jgi:H+ antiporter protein